MKARANSGMAGRDRLARRLLMSGVVPRQRPRPSLHGYTLVELMVAVAIVGILATLATYGVRKYLLAAKSAEPIEIINSIRASQESYKDETFKYLDVSSGVIDSYFPFDNANEMKGKAKSWLAGGDAILQGWDELGVRPSAAVQFGYACVAKDGQTPPSATDLRVEKSPLPASPSGWWYVVRAVGDRDGDGELSSFIGSSFTDHIYYESDTE